MGTHDENRQVIANKHKNNFAISKKMLVNKDSFSFLISKKDSL